MTTLFIKNIPANTRDQELVAFVRNATKPRFTLPFPVSTSLKCEILAILDKDLGSVECHGLAHIQPEKSAFRAIKRLNKTRLKGKVVFVREFHHRSWHNDRRSSARRRVPHNPERRTNDRRRQNLAVLDNITRRFITFENFNHRIFM